MSMSRSDSGDDTVRKRSGWLIPLAVVLVVGVLSVFFLLYYLFPTPPPLFAEQVSPTSDTTPVEVEISGTKLWIPSNYMVFESTRHGGRRREVPLFSILPDLSGWSNWSAGDFSDNSPKSPVVFITIREDRMNLSEADRMQRIYLAYITDPKGKTGASGLTRYAFRQDSGYRGEDLFAAQTAQGLMLLHCAKLSVDVPSPNCWRDMTMARGLSVTYRFKRSKLGHWRDIADNIAKLMDTFQHPPK